mmetsp:Transcript_19518/g.28496  ORF Transcript_19518/g.28496 Transcript_19518/m.28496 type:complete len:350 (-) Transcript_19518:1067-2116(-)
MRSGGGYGCRLRLNWGSRGLLRHVSCGHTCTGITRLWVEFDSGLCSLSSLRSTSSASPTTRDASSASWQALVSRHGISSTRLLHHGVSSTAGSTATRSAHHLGHHGVRGLHASSRSRSVHGSHVGIHWSHVSTSHHGVTGSTSTSTLVLCFELSSTDLLPLRKSDKDGLVSNELSVHFVDRTSGLFRGRVANKTESLGTIGLEILHNTGRSDGTHGGEFITEHIIRDVLIKVLDVQVNSLKLGDTIHLLCLELSTELPLTLALLLGAPYIKFLFDSLPVDNGLQLLSVELLNGDDGRIMLYKVHETESERNPLLFFLRFCYLCRFLRFHFLVGIGGRNGFLYLLIIPFL